jgi:hypothetical protein
MRDGRSRSLAVRRRADRYDYYEEGKRLILGGEDVAGLMDIFLHRTLAWGDPPNVAMD